MMKSSGKDVSAKKNAAQHWGGGNALTFYLEIPAVFIRGFRDVADCAASE